VIVADRRLRTLADFQHRQHFNAASGGHGGRNDRSGANGAPLSIRVPVGTTILDARDGTVLADLVEDGQSYHAAQGGRRGRGNARFATSVKQTPRFAEKGQPGEEAELLLQLKLLADVGIVGFPNAGKSTFISRVSAARPKIAPYPFTTLVPELGVVRMGEEQSFVLADMPGLIEGAHEGKGLGIRFLKHIERTRVLLHMIDLSAPDDPLTAFDAINRELAGYHPRLAELPQVVVGNKIDMPEAREILPRVTEALAARGVTLHPISAVTGEGVDAVLYRLVQELETAPAPARRPAPRGGKDRGGLRGARYPGRAARRDDRPRERRGRVAAAAFPGPGGSLPASARTRGATG
jgi:GTP-binding protein